MPRLSNSGRGGGSPHVERFLSEGAKRMAGCEIELDVGPNFKTHREARESGAAFVNQTVVSDPRLLVCTENLNPDVAMVKRAEDRV